MTKADQNTELSARTSVFLDLCRWAAAFVVVFGHVRDLVLTDFDALRERPNLAIKAIYFVAGFGHAAVIMFFVISGFLVGGRTIQKAAAGRFVWLDYMAQRTARIYIVLLPALIVGFILDEIGSRFVDNIGLYSHGLAFHFWSLDFAVVDRLNVGTFIDNVLMLQMIVVEPLGSNAPLWSLSYEWWYYVMFASLIGAIYRRRTVRAVSCVSALVLAVLLPRQIVLWFAIWLLGAVVSVLDRRWKGWPIWFGGLPLLVVLAFLRLRIQTLPPSETVASLAPFADDLIVAVAFSLVILSAKRVKWPMAAVHRRLASFSYSTYLVHFPAALLSVSFIQREFDFGIKEQPNTLAVVFMFGLIAFIYAYALLFAWIAEYRTETMRCFLISRVKSLILDKHELDGTYPGIHQHLPIAWLASGRHFYKSVLRTLPGVRRLRGANPPD